MSRNYRLAKLFVLFQKIAFRSLPLPFTSSYITITKKLPQELDQTLLGPLELSLRRRQEVEKGILQYRNVFATSDKLKKGTKLVQHKISTGKSTPIRLTPRRLTLAKRKETEKIIDIMEKENVIKVSNSPGVLPVLLVKKEG